MKKYFKTAAFLAITLLFSACTSAAAGSPSGPGSATTAPAAASAGSLQAMTVPRLKPAMDKTQLQEHPLLVKFKEQFGEVSLVTGIAGDCNGDDIEDLTVVFQHTDEDNDLVTIYSADGGYKLTDPIAAPLEDCLLQWNDIDERPPVELMVSGRKGVQIGYAVYRFEGGVWTSLFGDGMGNCC